MSMINLFKRSPELATGTEHPTPRYESQGESLEDILLELAKWGKPSLGMFGSAEGWHCEVNVTPVGVKFEAKSDFKQKTPLEAALMCRKNLLEAVKVIGGGK